MLVVRVDRRVGCLPTRVVKKHRPRQGCAGEFDTRLHPCCVLLPGFRCSVAGLARSPGPHPPRLPTLQSRDCKAQPHGWQLSQARTRHPPPIRCFVSPDVPATDGRDSIRTLLLSHVPFCHTADTVPLLWGFPTTFDWPSPFVFLPLSTRHKLDSCSEKVVFLIDSPFVVLSTACVRQAPSSVPLVSHPSPSLPRAHDSSLAPSPPLLLIPHISLHLAQTLFPLFPLRFFPLPPRITKTSFQRHASQHPSPTRTRHMTFPQHLSKAFTQLSLMLSRFHFCPSVFFMWLFISTFHPYAFLFLFSDRATRLLLFVRCTQTPP